MHRIFGAFSPTPIADDVWIAIAIVLLVLILLVVTGHLKL